MVVVIVVVVMVVVTRAAATGDADDLGGAVVVAAAFFGAPCNYVVVHSLSTEQGRVFGVCVRAWPLLVGVCLMRTVSHAMGKGLWGERARSVIAWASALLQSALATRGHTRELGHARRDLTAHQMSEASGYA